MNVLELRSDLHNIIDKITDKNVLQALKTLLSGKVVEKADWWETITEEERKDIELGLLEADKGEVIAHEDVMQKYQKWL
jgi:predicted transcriptional regulator